MTRSGFRWLALPCLSLLWMGAASAEPAKPPSAQISSLPEDVSAPTIDGRLDDEAWAHAALIGPLTQLLPVEGGPPSERTEVRITYDRDALYVAVQAFDREPDKIVASGMRRDTSLQPDDRISFLLDTFMITAMRSCSRPIRMERVTTGSWRTTSRSSPSGTGSGTRNPASTRMAGAASSRSRSRRSPSIRMARHGASTSFAPCADTTKRTAGHQRSRTKP